MSCRFTEHYLLHEMSYCLLACFPRLVRSARRMVAFAAQEILDNGVEIAPDTVVHVWKWWMDAAGQQTDLQSGAPAVCELSRGCRPTQAQAEDAGSDAWAQELAKVTSKVATKGTGDYSCGTSVTQ